MEIIKADSGDHPELSRIARIAKKHWGYPEEWLDLWKEDLVITPDKIISFPTYKLCLEDQVIGFSSLNIDPECIEVLNMWIAILRCFVRQVCPIRSNY